MKNKLNLKPGDFIFLILILIAGIFLTVKPRHQNASSILVQANGNSYQYSLNTDAIYDFEGPLGITKVEVKNGKVRIIDSPCPNKTCMNQNYRDTLVCLPNKIIIKIQTQGEFDAIAE